MKSPITVEAIINAPIEKVWQYWTEPEHIMKWSHASDDWHAPKAENDLRVGGTFMTRMESVDGKEGFDWAGVYTDVIPHERIEYDFGGRHVFIEFVAENSTVKVVETFDPEDINSEEMQKASWQAILDNFKKYTESN